MFMKAYFATTEGIFFVMNRVNYYKKGYTICF